MMEYALDGGQLVKEDFDRAKANGIDYMVAYNRFYNCFWEKERTITEPVKKRSEGLWPRFKELAAEHGICQNTFYQRMQFRDMTPEEAATSPIVKLTPANAKITPEVIRIANENGISTATLKKRVYRKKMDVETAMTAPVDASKRRNDFEGYSTGY